VKAVIAKKYLISLICLIVVCFAGCETMQQTLNLRKPTARLAGLKLEDVKLSSATLLFDVEIENHYPVPLPLTNFDYSLSSNNEKFLSGSADSQTAVPAKSKETVTLPATINYLELLKALKDVRPGSKIPYNAELGLSVKAPSIGLIRLPLKKEGQLVLPRPSDIEFRDIMDVMRRD
jgi:LEA14-like dessication related protein